VRNANQHPKNNGRIQRLDHRFAESGRLLGNWWCDLTGLSRNLLVDVLAVVSTFAILQHYVQYHRVNVLMFLMLPVASLLGVQSTRGGVREQIQLEAFGLPRNAVAFLRLQIIFLGLFFLMNGIAQWFAVAIRLPADGQPYGASLLLGLALVAAQASDYVRRTDTASGNRRSTQTARPFRLPARLRSFRKMRSTYRAHLITN